MLPPSLTLSRRARTLFFPLLAFGLSLGALPGCSGGGSGLVASKPATNAGIVAQETPFPTSQNSESNRVDLTFSRAENFNGDASAFKADSGDSFFRNGEDGFDGQAVWSAKRESITRRLHLSSPTQTKKAEAGDILLAAIADDTLGAPQLLVTYTEEREGGSSRVWESSGGQLKVLSADSAQAQFSLDVTMRPQSKDDGATGTFTLSGTSQIGN